MFAFTLNPFVLNTLVSTYTQLVGTTKKTDRWADVQKKLTDANFVCSVDDYSNNQIIADLKQSYSGTHTATQIADAIIACSKQRQKKITKQLFMLFVLIKLG